MSTTTSLDGANLQEPQTQEPVSNRARDYKAERARAAVAKQQKKVGQTVVDQVSNSATGLSIKDQVLADRARKAKERETRQRDAGQRLSRNSKQNRPMRTTHEHVVPSLYGVKMEDDTYRYTTVGKDRGLRYSLKQKGWQDCPGHELEDVENGVFVMRIKLDKWNRDYKQAVSNLNGMIGGETTDEDGDFEINVAQRGNPVTMDELVRRLPDASELDENFVQDDDDNDDDQ